jgi:pilus assembly protein CpaF
VIDLVAEQSPLGGLERWLADPAVSEVLVNGGGDVWVERRGRLERVGSMRTATLLGAIEHMLVPVGRRLDRSHPAVDARLADGSRLCAAIPPIAVDGPCLCIRRFSTQAIGTEHFAAPPVAALLAELVRHRCNVVVSGATSSGKTTLLNALAHGVPGHERIVTLEDVAELRLAHPHVVRLETREATPDGVAAIGLAHLLRTALRMRPDRLVVGEVRGDEALHLLQAMNTGHDGSLCTLHANAPLDALHRLAALVVQHSANWPMSAVHHHVVRAVDAVVHVARGADGRRRVAEVVEVLPEPHQQWGIAVRQLVSADAVVGRVTRCRA